MSLHNMFNPITKVQGRTVIVHTMFVISEFGMQTSIDNRLRKKPSDKPSLEQVQIIW